MVLTNNMNIYISYEKTSINLGWLQISDLHYVDHDIEQTIFTDTILSCCHDHLFQGNRVDFVVITGDFKNIQDNMFPAFSWIATLMDEDHLNLSMDSDLFLVPGNHDINQGLTETEKERREQIIKCLGVDFDKINKDDSVKESFINLLKDLNVWKDNGFDEQIHFMTVYQRILIEHKCFLLSLFSKFQINAERLVKYYQGNNTSVDTHIRTWIDKDNIPRINMIHLNTAMISDGKHDHKQIADILNFSEMLLDPKTDWTLPSLVIAHHSFYDLYPDIRDKLVQLMNKANVVAWICGDAHRFNNYEEKTYISRKLSDDPNNTWPVIVCGRSMADTADYWSDFGVQYYDWNNKLVHVYKYEWERNGSGKDLRTIPIRTFGMDPGSSLLRTIDLPQGKRYLDQFNINSFGDVNEDMVGQKTMCYIRNAMGKNSEGKSDKEILKQFLIFSDAIFNGDLRYNIPEFAYDIPRAMITADLYIDSEIVPLFNGIVTIYYREQWVRYRFKCQYIELNVVCCDDHVNSVSFGYTVLDNNSKERIKNLKRVHRFIMCDSFCLVFHDKTKKTIKLSRTMPEIQWNLQEGKGLIELWIDQIYKLVRIEQSYNLVFDLVPIHGAQNISALYTAIEVVFAGLLMRENGVYNFPISAHIEKDVKRPVLWEDDVKIPLKSYMIYGVSFVPRVSALLPGKIIKDRKKKVKSVPISILYAAEIGDIRYLPKEYYEMNCVDDGGG